MIRGFHTAATGLSTHQNHLNIVANNISNANTVGFKAMNASFQDLVYQSLERVEGLPEAQVGHGVKIAKSDVVMEQGPLQPTERKLDFALTNSGQFFAVRNPESDEIRYTHAGNFIISNDSDTLYLATASGDRVLDEDGSDIELQYNEEGQLDFSEFNLGVFHFANPYALELAGSNSFRAPELAGEAVAVEDPEYKQGYLEGSSVAVSDEMVKMIEASKAFSFNSRMVQVADEVEQVVNSLR
ncbi:flagellar hook-basal body protein [Oscillospiraceae bacterium MB08-C2-2]|nr:flagellar hook-basal body protein [Oscillospiraceae bacterium MB08-C2-2]